MNGLELSKAFYEEYGKPMLDEQFHNLFPFLAVGLFGIGSECFGYDDDISRDHDYEPGFCLFLPGEEIVSRRDAFLLERAYSRLPHSFRGYERASVLPVGGARHGVFRTGEFFIRVVGSPDGDLSTAQWLTLPEQALAEATNGSVFCDYYGEVTQIRKNLEYFPEDIRLKRLAGNLLLMAQSGPYNYSRCLRHNEPAAAQLAVIEFVKATLSVIFLLNRRYQPYYKWVFRSLRELTLFSELSAQLEFLLTTGSSDSLSIQKEKMIESISCSIIKELRVQSLTRAAGNELESHAYSVNDHIKDAELRNLHILAAV